MTMRDPRSSGASSMPGSPAWTPEQGAPPSTTPGTPSSQHQSGMTSGSNQPGPDDRGRVEQIMDRMSEQASPVTDQVQEKAGQVFSQARQQVTSRLDSQKDRAADGLMQAADAVRQTGRQMRKQEQVGPIANYTDQAAERIERVATFLSERDTNRILSDTERFARQRPAVFLAGAFTLGLAAARFFKSSTPQMGGGQSGVGLMKSSTPQSATTPSATFPMQRPTTPPQEAGMRTPGQAGMGAPASSGSGPVNPSSTPPSSVQRQPGMPGQPPSDRG